MLCQLSCVSQYCIVSYSIGNRNIFFIIWIITAQDKYIYLIWCQQICIFFKAIQRHISRWYHQITPLNQIWSFFFGGGGLPSTLALCFTSITRIDLCTSVLREKLCTQWKLTHTTDPLQKSSIPNPHGILQIMKNSSAVF